jgi:hypothetical protein
MAAEPPPPAWQRLPAVAMGWVRGARGATAGLLLPPAARTARTARTASHGGRATEPPRSRWVDGTGCWGWLGGCGTLLRWCDDGPAWHPLCEVFGPGKVARGRSRGGDAPGGYEPAGAGRCPSSPAPAAVWVWALGLVVLACLCGTAYGAQRQQATTSCEPASVPPLR